MKKWIGILAASAILGTAIVFFLLNSTNNTERLTEAGAMEKVVELYGGTAGRTTVSGNEILVEFQNDEGRYSAVVNRDSGQVASMELIEKASPVKNITEKQAEEIAVAEVQGEVKETNYLKEQNEFEVKVEGETEISTLAISADSGEIRKISSEETTKADPAPEEQPAPPVSSSVISGNEAIAIARQTLDGEVQEVEFVETQDGGYYLVEIENDATDQEATIQIHAIRGETMTVDWDD
ncbi:PepSY domain-containing protein [Planococcus sp. CAU13]|uniref:PepSY domain-containing protein n=1 Tax=Planococcus sp. CAU13 TaxID=1541197 RepID=UPI0006896294|nr:PepSY domain-containing protein [Planococcus sp. CAU13]